jgi:small-conductance mechanosensitive channel
MTGFNSENLVATFMELLGYIRTELLHVNVLIQFLLILGFLTVSFFIAKWVKPRLENVVARFLRFNRFSNNFFQSFLGLLPIIHFVVFSWITLIAYKQFGINSLLINLGLTVGVVWIVIKLASSVILDKFWSLTFSFAAGAIAVFSIFNVLDPMLSFLDDLGFTLGEVRISVLSLFKALILLFVALRIAKYTNAYFDKQLQKVTQLNASARVLISKTVSGAIYFFIGLIVLNSIGIDFTALAVFGGALGVGLGFGLQKVVSNLISGIILLSDRSIKPGDVIQIGEVYGWISSLRGRYVSVVTRDGHEYLIPNEDLITQQVINWSFSDTLVRLRVPFGISYKSDPHEVKQLVLEAVQEMPRILRQPPPVCLLTGFGDSSVDLELRLWINDPKNGIGNIKSEVLFKIWDVLRANNIEIPFPQRDIHIKNAKD